MPNIQKCAIIGCGLVGATTAYSLMQNALFSEMVLIDIDRKKAEGEAADLNHGLPFLSPIDIYAGDYSDLTDAAVIIIAAGANQQNGQTRLDLVRQNAAVFQAIIPSVTRYNHDGLLFIVSNPVDLLTHLSIQLSDFPAHRVIGSGTVLDTARLKYLVGRYLNVDFRNVHSFIIGEHGDSELAVWSGANVSGIDLDRFCESCHASCQLHRLDELFREAKNSAYQIISAKGATYYAIAESVKKIIGSVVKDENTILPVSTLLSGQYGLSDVVLSVPCVIGRHGVQEILEIPLNEEERRLFLQSADKMKQMMQTLTR